MQINLMISLQSEDLIPTSVEALRCYRSKYSHHILLFLDTIPMAEALVGGSVLSGFINVVFDRLLSPGAVNLIKGKKVVLELLPRLKTALSAATALVDDSERRQFNEPYVKEWLYDLKDAVYKADDLLDLVLTKVATERKVRASLIHLPIFKDREIVNEFELLVSRIEYILRLKDILGLKEVARDNNYLSSSSWRTTALYLVKENIYGREDDQEAIMKKIQGESDGRQLSVIPIVGMGGVGKTTLARWLYNNDDFMKGFDLKAWVFVPQEFDIVEVTKTIIEGISNSTCNLEDLNLLQLDLKEKLSAKKFFVVLDDVWSDIWNNFMTPFQCGAMGSTVLITTRSKDVASMVQTCAPYFLNVLSEDCCWSVFADSVPESNGSSFLEEIGRKIVKKCKGLPFAAKALGHLLRTKREVLWNTVLMSDIWETALENSYIIKVLLISYYHLPAHLKYCFVYCSLFPKDHKFIKEDLILLWMAEGLLPPPKMGETLEEVGNECFDKLASSCFFEQHGEYFLMHDLMHDLAKFTAGDFYCRLEELGKAEMMSSNTRHLSYGSLSDPISKNYDSIDKVKSLRTFLQVNFSSPSFSVERAPHIIISKLKYLRVLSFCSFKGLDLLPDSIGELIHLRYLDLSDTSIKTLPESFCSLYNLQTLKLRGCSRLTMLPKGMHNLLNLRHLDLRETLLQEIPKGMSKLKHLHVLGDFVYRVEELGELSYSDGILELTNLENIADRDEAMGGARMMKTDVDKLILKWSSSADIVSVSSMQTENNIFGKLQPHYGLKELKFRGYWGTTFPNWVGHSSYQNMTCVSLNSCRSCRMLPSLGQLPSLKSLKIKHFDKLETIGVEFYKNKDDPSSSLASPFSSLEDLTFMRMPCWKMWSSFISYNAFPQLKKLSIVDCPKLKGDLPNHLPALETLEIEKCHQLIVSSLPRAPEIRILEIAESDKVGLQELPLSLGSLSIRGCQQVESLFRAMSINHPTRLESITISNCLYGTSLPWECLPESLTTLRIKNCRELEFPSQQLQKHKLEKLELDHSCDSLALLQLEAFPELKDLTIKGCENLESFSFSEPQHNALDSLKISDCPKLVSFPKEGLAAPNMTSFWVIGCKELKSLPRHMNTLLPNLNYLVISDCPDIDSFPEGGLPPSLKELQVKNCEKLLSNLSSMGVHEALTDLYICGSACKSIKSFPNEGLFPGLPSLTTMCLRGFPNMETLECKELLRFTSLRNLYIDACPKLEKIAGERLPDTLLVLGIYECPLLAEHCKEKHSQIWPKISHIRGIQVDYRCVS